MYVKTINIDAIAIAVTLVFAMNLITLYWCASMLKGD